MTLIMKILSAISREVINGSVMNSIQLQESDGMLILSAILRATLLFSMTLDSMPYSLAGLMLNLTRTDFQTRVALSYGGLSQTISVNKRRF